MKIWCLRCGHIIAKTDYSETKNVVCPCCSEKMAYSVKNGTGYIACLAENNSESKLFNNSLYIVAGAQSA